MAIPKRNMRGLSHIRTLSGSVYQTLIPYRAYMKVSTLEMEKTRRGIERKSAKKRIEEIDVRLQEIEVEKASILRMLGEQNSDGAGGKAPSLKTKSSVRRSGGGVKFQY